MLGVCVHLASTMSSDRASAHDEYSAGAMDTDVRERSRTLICRVGRGRARVFRALSALGVVIRPSARSHAPATRPAS